MLLMFKTKLSYILYIYIHEGTQAGLTTTMGASGSSDIASLERMVWAYLDPFLGPTPSCVAVKKCNKKKET